MRETYLELKNLTKSFESLEVVKNINLDIYRGELISILGPSGCGKTTILKMIGGFLEPTEGEIILEGVNITDTAPENRPITTVFQSYALFPHMNVIQNVGYGLRYRKDYSKKESLSKAEEMLEIVGLKEFSRKSVTSLSGGQQQRVALARALILNPKVLLLDEPFSNLDAKLRIKMRNEIKDIKQRFDTTMILVTHDQEEALSISDRIVIVNDKKIEQIGTPKEIYNNPQNVFVANFIGKSNIIEKDGEVKLLRPENMKIVESEGDYKGIILQKQFLGSYTSYFVELDEEDIKDIFQIDISYEYDRDWEVGEEVMISAKTKSKKMAIKN